MANNDLNKRFFTNTYITGSGRQNYLRIDHLEDPLFTSFTFDIDYVTSPLFYTINYSDYGYPNVEGMSEKIDTALTQMYGYYMRNDGGYDILPVLSASILDGNKLGFGLQQNVFMDMPLYGATEYIHMVDKRNGGAYQNDARFDSNQFVDDGGNPNALNSYKLGDSVKEIVNDSDRAWAERKFDENKQQAADCQEIMNEAEDEHKQNYIELYGELPPPDGNGDGNGGLYGAMLKANVYSVKEKDENGNEVDVEYTEAQLMDKVNEFKTLDNEFEYFQREIVEWANDTLSSYRNRGTSIYNENKCVQKIFSYDDLNEDTNEKYAEKLEKEFGSDFREECLFRGEDSYFMKFYNLYSELETTSTNNYWEAHNPNAEKTYRTPKDDGKSFLLDLVSGDGMTNIRSEEIIKKFRDKLDYFGMLVKGENESVSINFKVFVTDSEGAPDWALNKFESHFTWFDGKNSNYHIDEMIRCVMTYQCDINISFDESFTSEKVKANKDKLDIYEDALDQIRYKLYGVHPDGSGNPGDSSNPDPYSPYGEYLAAKEKYDNDDYAQAEKAQALANSGMSEMQTMIGADDYQESIAEANYYDSIKVGAQPLEVSRKESITPSQTVLDMLGFISGMKKMTMDYPYIIQGISGLDNAYKNHYFIKDPYMGSGDDKITLTCLESLDLRVSSMFNRYFNAVYDRQYRRERVPVNLRRFNCSVYVHDVRNFVSKMRYDKYGNQQVTYNRLLELTDMYYSVIEFKFFDCEIVPEETGNIFDNISNESPSEMKKTNFTFTYGNCVVNFVPQSEVVAHNVATSKNKDELTRN